MFERISTVISSLNSTFARMRSLSIQILEDMTRYATRLNSWIQSLAFSGFIRYEKTPFHFELPSMKRAITPGTDLPRFSFIWKMPPTTNISRLLSRVRDQTLKLKRLSETSRIAPPALFHAEPLSVVKETEFAASRVHELLEAGFRAGEIYPVSSVIKDMDSARIATATQVSGILEASLPPIFTAKQEVLQYSSRVPEATGKAYEAAGPKLTESLAKAALSSRSPAGTQIESSELPVEEDVALPIVLAKSYFEPSIIETVKTAQLYVARIVSQISSTFAAVSKKTLKENILTESTLADAYTAERWLAQSMEKGFEEATPIPSPIKPSTIVAKATVLCRSFISRIFEATKRGGIFSYPIIGMQQPLTSSYTSMLLKASRRGVAVADIEKLYAGIESYAAEKMPGELVLPPRTLKLPEAAHLMNLFSALSQSTRPTRVQRPVNLTVKVESLAAEQDLRELERKIARILRDAARRYGVSV